MQRFALNVKMMFFCMLFRMMHDLLVSWVSIIRNRSKSDTHSYFSLSIFRLSAFLRNNHHIAYASNDIFMFSVLDFTNFIANINLYMRSNRVSTGDSMMECTRMRFYRYFNIRFCMPKRLWIFALTIGNVLDYNYIILLCFLLEMVVKMRMSTWMAFMQRIDLCQKPLSQA